MAAVLELLPMTLLGFCYVLLMRTLYKGLLAASSWLPRKINKPVLEEKRLIDELKKLKAEQASISAQDEFARFVRLQRKIDKLSEELIKLAQVRKKKIALQQTIFKVLFIVCLVTVHILFIATNRSTPVIEIPAQWFHPLQTAMAFPTGIPGAIGIPCWMVTCNRVIGTYII